MHQRTNLYSRVLKPTAKAAGLPWAGFHTFRHTCATMLFRHGLNAVQVQLWLGHHCPGFTMATYLHLLPEDLPAPDLDALTWATAEGHQHRPPMIPQVTTPGGRDARWSGSTGLEPRSYMCGHCGRSVGPNTGYSGRVMIGGGAQDYGDLIYICSYCGRPTYFSPESKQVPGVAYGSEVDHLPDGVRELYREARDCIAANAYTASVMAARKLLMNIAVEQGAPVGKSFIEYVKWLATKGFVPPNGTTWVDHIRTKGNEANHEIALMTQADAEELIFFTEMLLRFVYEFPNRVPAPPP